MLAVTILATAALLAGPTIDNARVRVWETTLGRAAFLLPAQETVVMFLDPGAVRLGDAPSVRRKAGDALFLPHGVSGRGLVSDTPVRAVVIALKDTAVAPLPRPPGLPPGFPRPGAAKILENGRVTVWTYTWQAGVPTAMHFHDKDVVIAYRFDGAIESVEPNGRATTTAFRSGQVRFAPRDRTHFERLVAGSQAAVLTELK